MGCWNGTCAVTGLPIFDNDEVEVILIKTEPSSDGSSFCYQYSYHAPLPFTFHGQYNDYGAVEDCSGAALDIILDAFRKTLTEREELRRFENGVKREDLNVKMIFDLDHAGLLYVDTKSQMQHDMRDSHRVSHITVHKHVYDSIVKQIKLDTWHTDDGKYETLEIDLEYYRKEYAQYTKDLDDILKEEEADDDKEKMMRRLRYDMSGTIGKTKVGAIVGLRGYDSYAMQYPIRLADIMLSMREEGKDITDVLDNAVQLYMFNMFMMQARRSWHKPSGCGSQDSETAAQVLAAELTIEVAAVQKNYWDEI